MRALVIDDEKNVRNSLIRLLKGFCPEVEVIGEADSLASGLALIPKISFDILFLDVELPDGSGIDLLNTIKERNFQVIFVTAYNQYAIDAFRLSAIDYLLKPVDPDHLIEAVQKAKKWAGTNNQETALSILIQNMDPALRQGAKLILRDADNMYVVQVKEILRCEADGSYTRFFLTNNRTVLTSINLKEYEKLLGRWDFVRPHHSHLINLHHVTRFDKTNGGFVFLTEGTEVPVSFRKKDQLITALQKLSLN